MISHIINAVLILLLWTVLNGLSDDINDARNHICVLEGGRVQKNDTDYAGLLKIIRKPDCLRPREQPKLGR